MEDEFNQDDDSSSSIGFSFPPPAGSGREVLRVESLDIGYTTPLSKNINFKLEKGQKIAIIGANGIGKSTLLKTLSKRISPLEGAFHFGFNVLPTYFAQDQLEIFDSERSVFENIMASSDANIGQKQIMSILGSFLFRGSDSQKKVKVLSGGEKSRLGLACLLTQKSNFLLLDEPTNHLDMSSASMLSVALDDYEGSALFVSHDRDFINSVATHVLVMLGDGRSRIFEGNLADYERLATLQGFPNVLQTTEESVPVKTEKVNPNGKLEHELRQAEKRERQKKERDLKRMESEIEQLHETQKKLEAGLAKAQDLSQGADLQNQLNQTLSRLATLEEKWLELSSLDTQE
jgi:ATP-binding cassette subfamily F protein 3